MTDSTRLGRAGKAVPTLATALMVAMLLTLLALAPRASAAAPVPVSYGKTTLVVSEGFATKLEKAKVRLAVVKPSSFRGNTVSFPVTGGEVRLTGGKGGFFHGGGLKFRSDDGSVTLKRPTLDTRSRSLTLRSGGRTIRFARFSGNSAEPVGFGEKIDAKRLKLTGAGAKALKKVSKAFKAGAVLGSAVTEFEPTVLDVAPTGSIAFTGDPALLGKLKDVGVEVQPVAPTAAAGQVFTSFIDGGTISPFGDSGSIESSGGIRLVQALPGGPTSTITLGSFGVEIGGKTASAEVIGESNAEAEGRMPLNLGSPGRTSVADLSFGTVTPDPAERIVTIAASATIQPLAAEVLAGFAKVFQGYYAQMASATLQTEIKDGKKPAMSEAEVKAVGAKAAEAKVAADQIRAGEALGSFSFVATAE